MRRAPGRLSVRRAILSSLALALAMGADAPRVQIRDRELLEVVLADVMDPKNPEYRGLDPDQLNRGLIVLDSTTGVKDEVFHGPALDSAIKDRRTSRDLGDAWSKRNSGPPVSTKEFRFKDKWVLIDDLDAIGEDTVGPDQFAEAFRKKHPGTWGWVIPTLSGFSPDGRTAVVLFRNGPSPHGSLWTYKLVWIQDHWNVVYRRHQFRD